MNTSPENTSTKHLQGKYSPTILRIAEILAPVIRDMINDPNVIFTREDHTGTARLPKKNESTPQ